MKCMYLRNFGSWDSALGLDSSVVHNVLIHQQRSVHAGRTHVRDETESSRSSRNGILHNDCVRYRTKLLEVALQSLIGRLKREAANEDFAAMSVAQHIVIHRGAVRYSRPRMQTIVSRAGGPRYSYSKIVLVLTSRHRRGRVSHQKTVQTLVSSDRRRIFSTCPQGSLILYILSVLFVSHTAGLQDRMGLQDAFGQLGGNTPGKSRSPSKYRSRHQSTQLQHL